MAVAGTVEINFAAETAKFTAELRKVRGQLTDLQKQTATISKGFAAAGKALVGFISVAAITGTIRAVARATAEAEESAARLDNALQSSSAAVSLTTQRLQDYATQLQRTTTFGDEAIQDVQSLLLSFRGLSGDTVLRATAAVTDLSARMRKDLSSAAELVGKALQDPEKGLTALRRAGVAFSVSQQEAIKRLVETGERSRAQNLILQELEKRFGGAAEAARNNFGGALTAVQNSLGDLLETKGGLPAASASLNQLAEVLQDPGVKQGADTLFSALITGASKFVEIIGETVAGLKLLITNRGGNDLVNIDNEIDALEARRDALTNFRSGRSGDFGSDFALGRVQQIAALNAQIAVMRQLWQDVSDGIANVDGSLKEVEISARRVAAVDPSELAEIAERRRQAEVSTMIDNLLIEVDIRDQIEEEAYQKRIGRLDREHDATQAYLDQRLSMFMAAGDRETQAVLQAEQTKFDAFAAYQQAKRAMEQATLNAGIGLLQALAVRSKSAAKALILIQRGLAIAQVIQSTAAAVMKAFQVYGPTPAGYAQAAAMKVMGGIQVGLIAATAGIEVSNVGSGNAGGIGGSTLGTPSNPLPVAPQEPAGAQGGRVINVNINGNVAGPEASRWLIEAIADMINGNDTIIINGTSRQAAEIRGD